ncbi:hypothetical protein EJO70_26985 [Variovorax sp. 553]|nr:hypothetical protein EJO70_26985 [Variovorax sp. 553]RSZ34973.1 hypothetical protein EJO71_26985 [Variovorax sp. 679]
MELEQDIVNGSNTVKLRTVTITRGRESFRDVSPVRRLRTQYYGTGGSATDRQYMDYIDGKIVRYGVRNGGEDAGSLDYAYNDPPVVTPTMSPGQTVDMNYTVKSVEGPNGEIRNQQVITGTDTYVGRESLETPMGAINACKFSGVVRFRQVDGSDRTEYQDNWIAAEGPYRGQLLRFAARTGDTTTNFVTTKITYTPR